MEKKELVARLLAAKEASGKTYDELADALGYCNVYVGQLFHAQAQLKEDAVSKLAKLVPELDKELPRRDAQMSYAFIRPCHYSRT